MAAKGMQGQGNAINWKAAQSVMQQSASGTGKGGPVAKAANKELEKLRPLDSSLKVWVGGLRENTSWKKLRDHFGDIGKVKVAMMNGGKACLAFETAEEASSAIATFNGSDFSGKKIEVDVWTQHERKPTGQHERKKQKKLNVLKTSFKAKADKGKKGADGKADTTFWEKLKGMHDARKVRVTNLAEDVTGKQLYGHCKSLGVQCYVLNLMSKQKGTACVGFKTATRAKNAIAVVGGSELNGQTLEVTPWAKPEKTHNKKDKKNEE